MIHLGKLLLFVMFNCLNCEASETRSALAFHWTKIVSIKAVFDCCYRHGSIVEIEDFGNA